MILPHIPLAPDALYVILFSHPHSLGREDLKKMSLILDQREQHRYQRYINPVKKESFVLSHYLLKTVIRQALNVEIQDIAIETNHLGKPRIMDQKLPLRFNLSHSGIMTAISLALNLESGIDIEKIQKNLSLTDYMIKKLFRSDFLDYFHSLSPQDQRFEFYKQWTKTEAVYKCCGLDLTKKSSRDEPLINKKIFCHSVESLEDYMLSVCVSGQDLQPVIHKVEINTAII